MPRQASTMLGDSEYEYVSKALSKSGMTMYEFVKHAVLESAEKIIHDPAPSVVPAMVEALLARKWHLYQMDDYSDANHLAWLKTRFPQALEKQLRQAITDFRLAQKVPR